MSWKNFEGNIVDEYQVVLDRSPNTVFDPSNVGYKVLESILLALKEGTCQ